MNVEYVFFCYYFDFVDVCLGSQVVVVSDEWFVLVSCMLQVGELVWKEGVFDDSGKWMDGWEICCKCFEGYDQVVICLGVLGVLKGVDIDICFFIGNYLLVVFLDGCFCVEGDLDDSMFWSEVLVVVGLQGDSYYYYLIDDECFWIYLCLNIYLDGGIVCLCFYGVFYCDWSNQLLGMVFDLVVVVNGGWVLVCFDQYFGCMGNLFNFGCVINMGDGWEIGCCCMLGYDWVIVVFGYFGSIEVVVVDILYFKGNYLESCSIQVVFVEGGNEVWIEVQSFFWCELLLVQKLEMYQEYWFEWYFNVFGLIIYVCLNIFFDGGVSCLCLFGRL